MLKKYDPDDELIVAYWDKEWFTDMTEREINDEQWFDVMSAGESVVENMGIGEYLHHTAIEILEAENDQ
jgi:hypothetical protein